MRECIVCFRCRPRFVGPLMGKLPAARVSSAVVPFLKLELSMQDRFFCKDRQCRGIKRFKCNMCLFICLTVKAVLLEMVTDLSTEAFFQAFQRFIARRVQPRNIYSDNGTNFKEANNQFNELVEFLRTSESSISRQLGTE